MNFEKLVAQMKPKQRKRVAVAAAEDDVILKAVAEAYRLDIAEPILCGDKEKIMMIAAEHGVDIAPFTIMEATDGKEAARLAVELVRKGDADMLMKGLLQTADLLRAVLNKENGLRGGGVLSHVSILYSDALMRPLLLTDAAMVPYPDLKTKVELVKNAVKAAKGLGIQLPKVAPLAAVEVINPEMQATVDAAALTAMNRRGQITDCMVDGPLSMDLALSAEAVRHKGVDSPVAGQSDILLFHNIEAANSALKVFTIVGECLFGGIIMGAAVPIVLASRSDTDRSKLYSIACAASICI